MIKKKIHLKTKYKFDFIGWLCIKLEFENNNPENIEISKIMLFKETHPLYEEYEITFRSKAYIVCLKGKPIPSLYTIDIDGIKDYSLYSSFLFIPWNNNDELLLITNKKCQDIKDYWITKNKKIDIFDFSIQSSFTPLAKHVLSNIQDIYIAKSECKVEKKKNEELYKNYNDYINNHPDENNNKNNKKLDDIYEMINFDFFDDDDTLNTEQEYNKVFNEHIEKSLNDNITKSLQISLYYNKIITNHNNNNNIIKIISKNTSKNSNINIWNNIFKKNINDNKLQGITNNTLPEIKTIEDAINCIKLGNINTNFNTKTKCFINPLKLSKQNKLNPKQHELFMFLAHFLLIQSRKNLINIEEVTGNNKKKDDLDFDYPNPPKIIYTGGEAGSGKTYTLQTLKEFACDWQMSEIVVLTASLGIAAMNLETITYHLFLEFSKYKHPSSKNTFTEVEKNFALLGILIIDECSLISCSDLNKINTRLKELRQSNDNLANIILVLIGDFSQNMPINATSLINSINLSTFKHSTAAIIGASLFQASLTHVFSLNHVYRQDESSKLMEIFRHIRSGRVTIEDADYMNNETLISETKKCHNPLLFPYIPFIVFSHNARFKIQQIVLHSIQKYNQHLYHFPAEITETKNNPLSNDQLKQIYRLPEHFTEYNCTQLVLFENMPVIYTNNNICIHNDDNKYEYIHSNQFGIANGTRAIIKRFIYNSVPKFEKHNIHLYGSNYDVLQGSILPDAIIIEVLDPIPIKLINNLKLEGLNKNEFPVYTYNRHIHKITPSGQHIEFKMNQFPLLPAIAITGHKYEGFNAKNGVVIVSNSTKEWLYTSYTRAPSICKIWSFVFWDSHLITQFNNITKIKKDFDRFLNKIQDKTDKEIKNLLPEYLEEKV